MREIYCGCGYLRDATTAPKECPGCGANLGVGVAASGGNEVELDARDDAIAGVMLHSLYSDDEYN